MSSSYMSLLDDMNYENDIDVEFQSALAASLQETEATR